MSTNYTDNSTKTVLSLCPIVNNIFDPRNNTYIGLSEYEVQYSTSSSEAKLQIRSKGMRGIKYGQQEIKNDSRFDANFFTLSLTDMSAFRLDSEVGPLRPKWAPDERH